MGARRGPEPGLAPPIRKQDTPLIASGRRTENMQSGLARTRTADPGPPSESAPEIRLGHLGIPKQIRRIAL